MKRLFQKAFSYISNKPVQLGYGISVDSETTFPKEAIQNKLAESKNSAKYELNTEVGQFEMINLIHRPGQKAPTYKLRHILTGQNIEISENLFKLFFKNVKS